jgi:metal transporter CNNM
LSENILLIFEVALLVGLSAICSGLNIALMSLDLSDLERKAKTGNDMALRVWPLRKNAHLTLASILLANVAAVSATSLVLDTKLQGWVAGLLTTLLIVVLGEILPQAWFVRRALSTCARFAPIIRLMIVCTYPVSKPLQLLLDKLFSDQGRQLHTRSELSLLITEHLGHNGSELDEDEVEIIRGALQLSEKRVRDIMTPLKKVYWLGEDTIINSDKIDEIKLKGWSRIPVLNKRFTKCYGVLMMKDLVDIDFDEEPRPITQALIRPTKVVGSMTALDTLFRKFIGARSHLMPVERDDQIIGIVTIEDLIEEIIGHEIEDETH